MKCKYLILKVKRITIFFLIIFIVSCSGEGNRYKQSKNMENFNYEKGTFGYDLHFLKKYIDPVVLSDEAGKAAIIISKEWQGRVMTSTANGNDGNSYGWINYSLIESGEIQEHINAFGGEDRIWFGPEGGQFSIYFKKDVPFEFQNWYVPKEIDTESFELVDVGKDVARFEKDMSLENYSGFKLNVKLNRDIKLMNQEEVEFGLGIKLNDGLNVVAYSTENIMTNTGEVAWTKKTGMLSIWILGMFTPAPNVTIVIPYRTGNEEELGPVVNDSYFGKISQDRLIVEEGLIFFRADGKSRGKIGISPLRAYPLAGSYDEDSKTLTIVKFSLPEGKTDYVNSIGEIQDDPFKGDAVNSYNDGPLDDGSQMGPFYELESSSPAGNLKPGESLTHIHSTFHFQGEEELLDKIAQPVLGTNIESIKLAF